MGYKGEIPFDSKGNQFQHPSDAWSGSPIIWKQAEEFDASLKIVDFYSGRSAKGLCLADMVTGCTYTMFTVDFAETVQKTVIDHGVISGRWEFRKRGQNYGVRPVVE